ncbi:ABC transporter permease [Microbacterium terricola]|uniref:Ribose ABC transporter permease n=1 Tax=Microbacterium terricola TaxID=344163 RepID=A0ABM8E117_9MICO|nr:ABC transporter permease [Microbacterium terricola]UYK40802.1 ABC transporter permease [Microbacterium terricola]BDV31450.1 ribose ABC transporter permease [Microbacterium terricola]
MSDTQTVVAEDATEGSPSAQSGLARLVSRMPRAGWGIAIFIALFVIGGLLRPSLFTLPGLISTATFAAILAVASYGQTIAVIQGGIDLSVPNTIAFAALGFLTWNASFGPVIALLLALAGGLVIGIVNGVIVAKVGLTPIVTTIAMNGLLFGVVLLNFPLSELTVVPDLVTSFTSARVDLAGLQIAIVLPMALLLMLLLQAVLSYTGWGRSLFLVGSREDAARLAGQPVARIRISGYALSGLLAAFAGIVIVGYYSQAETTMGNSYLLGSVAAVIVGGASMFGGRGSMVGTFVGALVLGQVATLVAVFNLGATMQNLIYGLIILAVLAAYGRDRT